MSGLGCVKGWAMVLLFSARDPLVVEVDCLVQF